MTLVNAPINTVDDQARHEGQEETQCNEKGKHHLHSKEQQMYNEQVRTSNSNLYQVKFS